MSLCKLTVAACLLTALLPLGAATQESDLANLAEQAQSEQAPISAEQFTQFQKALRQTTGALDRALAQAPGRSGPWKAYLLWQNLETQLAPNPEINRDELAKLDKLIARLHANKPGLELPVFTATARALERYREAAFWVALGEARDPAPIFNRLLADLAEQLRRHAEQPTPETRWKIGRTVSTLKLLDSAAPLTSAVEETYSQPNILASFSETGINRLADQPVTDVGPVRETILGNPTRGTAHTTGRITVDSVPSDDTIQLALHFEGISNTRTSSYRKPVCIWNTGKTDFKADASLTFSEDAFRSSDPTATADTDTTIRSISKTGGNVGRKLVEKIAWKKACQLKPCAEQEASWKAARRVAERFNERLTEVLQRAENRYQARVAAPLARRNALPRSLRFESHEDWISLVAAMAPGGYLAAAGPPPQAVDGDIVVQLHESAVDNVLPLLVGGITIKQDEPDQKPQIVGEVPPWLAKLSSDTPQPLAAATEAEAPPFEPWHMRLNEERPASVTFEDQKLTLRLRAAELSSTALEEPIKNWDLLVSYRVVPNEHGLVLERDGEIDAFPTGFDPRWDTKLTSKQLSLRKTLAGNMNARAEAGQGFPAGIPIEGVNLPLENFRDRPLLLNQVDCNKGWLTLVWSLP